MMISTKGRYALRVMIDLAQHNDGSFISLKEIAARQGISMKYLEMIVSLLHKGGVVQSQRGKEGGYRLSRPATAISVQEIMHLTEGSLAPVQCLSGEKGPACDRSDACLTLPMWQQLDALIDGYLSAVSVQDLLEGRLPQFPSAS